MNRRATRVGSFEVFEVAHVASRIPEIARSNYSQPAKPVNLLEICIAEWPFG
jgi:hypothetical protein